MMEVSWPEYSDTAILIDIGGNYEGTGICRADSWLSWVRLLDNPFIGDGLLEQMTVMVLFISLYPV
jgi:hypothetical protein